MLARPTPAIVVVAACLIVHAATDAVASVPTLAPSKSFHPTGTLSPTESLLPTYQWLRDVMDHDPLTDCEKVTLWLNDQILQANEQRIRRELLEEYETERIDSANKTRASSREMAETEHELERGDGSRQEAVQGHRDLSWLSKYIPMDVREYAEKKYKINVDFIGIAKPKSNIGHVGSHHSNKFMEVLNWGFRKTPFEFVHQQTTNYDHEDYFNCWQGNQHLIKEEHHDQEDKKGSSGPKADTLYLYVCDNRKSNLIGWATFPNRVSTRPSQDGIFIRHPSTSTRGTADPFEIYSTIVHEVGHWLGLLHTFEGGCHNEKEPRLGDGVNDTAPHKKPSWIFDDFEACFQDRKAPQGRGKKGWISTCSAREPDPTNNQMNYIDGWCALLGGEFTPLQVKRMESQFLTYRRPKIGRRILAEADISTWMPPSELLMICKRAANRICQCDMDCASKVVGVLEHYGEVQQVVYDMVLDNFEANCKCEHATDAAAEFFVITSKDWLALPEQESVINWLARKCFADAGCDLPF